MELGSRTGLEQHFYTVLLDSEVRHGDLRGLVLGLIHAHEVASGRNTVAYLTIDMLDLTGQRRGYILSEVALEVG